MRIGLITLLTFATASVATAAPRKLTLQEAVSAALHVDPLVAEAHLGNDRARLGVFRAQLDRFSFKIDGSVQELWNMSNIGGSTLYDCTFAGMTTPASQAEWISFGGVATPSATQQPSQWSGLSNFQASLNYFLFSGFRVEANVHRAKAGEQAALVQIKQQRKDLAIQNTST